MSKFYPCINFDLEFLELFKGAIVVLDTAGSERTLTQQQIFIKKILLPVPISRFCPGSTRRTVLTCKKSVKSQRKPS